MTQTSEERRFVRMACAMNKKAAILDRAGHIRAVDLARAFVAAKGRCAYCGIGLDAMHCSFDHVVSFEQGGVNTPENIVACCLSCQRSKGTKSVDEFIAARVLTKHLCDACGRSFKPRWADWRRGYGRLCSRECAGRKGGEARSPAALSI